MECFVSPTMSVGWQFAQMPKSVAHDKRQRRCVVYDLIFLVGAIYLCVVVCICVVESQPASHVCNLTKINWPSDKSSAPVRHSSGLLSSERHCCHTLCVRHCYCTCCLVWTLVVWILFGTHAFGNGILQHLFRSVQIWLVCIVSSTSQHFYSCS